MGSMRSVGTIQLPSFQAFAKAFFGCLLASSPVLAGADGERAVLARLVHELETLDGVIRSAESQSDPDARLHFRYDWLRQDVERVRRGIQDHIDAPRVDPRILPPLRGDYRQ